MTLIHVPCGIKGTLEVEIADKNLVLDTDRSFPSEFADLDQAILKALEQPVAGPFFSEQLDKARKFVILVDNFAKLTPAYKILPPLLGSIEPKTGEKWI